MYFVNFEQKQIIYNTIHQLYLIILFCIIFSEKNVLPTFILCLRAKQLYKSGSATEYCNWNVIMLYNMYNVHNLQTK